MADRIYECEIKRPFMRNGQKVLDWKRVSVAEVQMRSMQTRSRSDAPNSMVRFAFTAATSRTDPRPMPSTSRGKIRSIVQPGITSSSNRAGRHVNRSIP